MDKITPGPWKAQQDCRSFRNEGIFDGSNPDRYGNQNAWGIYAKSCIALLVESSDWNDQDTINANARLIAAAPELLEALQDVTASLSMYLFNEGGSDALRQSRTLLTAQNAIAKARGK